MKGKGFFKEQDVYHTILTNFTQEDANIFCAICGILLSVKNLDYPVQELLNKAVYTREVNRRNLDDSLCFITITNLRHFQTH